MRSAEESSPDVLAERAALAPRGGGGPGTSHTRLSEESVPETGDEAGQGP